LLAAGLRALGMDRLGGIFAAALVGAAGAELLAVLGGLAVRVGRGETRPVLGAALAVRRAELRRLAVGVRAHGAVAVLCRRAFSERLAVGLLAASIGVVATGEPEQRQEATGGGDLRQQRGGRGSAAPHVRFVSFWHEHLHQQNRGPSRASRADSWFGASTRRRVRRRTMLTAARRGRASCRRYVFESSHHVRAASDARVP